MRQRRPSNSTMRWMPGIDLQPANWNGGGTESWKRSRQSSNRFPVSNPSATGYRLKRKSEYVRWAITSLKSGRATTVPRHLQRIPVKLTRIRHVGSSCGILYGKVSARKHRRVGIEYERSARKTFADRL